MTLIIILQIANIPVEAMDIFNNWSIMWPNSYNVNIWDIVELNQYINLIKLTN